MMLKTNNKFILVVGILICLLTMMTLMKHCISSSSQVDQLRVSETMPGWKYNTTFPVDVVYTWVNGSDTDHRDTLARLRAELSRLNLLTAARARNIKYQRFADNGGLRYSLRSLEKYANWIRHVFIVTNGQVPNWLDLRNPRVTVVTHKEIFDNIDYLPTFSSTAIEHNLHKIPGLSEKFIYLNDDIFFGLHTSLDDFYTEEKGTKIYQGDLTPLKCSATCSIQMIRNDVCDWACNFDHCVWDGGDCDVTAERSRPKDTDDAHSDHDISIFYTNAVFNKAFGYKQRRYNLHAPLFIEKSINLRMLNRFPTEIKQTCRQAVRNPFDLQFGFSYMNFLMEAHNHSRYETFVNHEAITFVAITSDVRKTREEFLSLKSLKSKFYCFNDDIEYNRPSAKKIIKMLDDFYKSKFPFPSSFER